LPEYRVAKVRHLNMYQYTECGLDNVYLINGYARTHSPSGKGIQIYDIDKLHKVISRNLVEKESPLSPQEFKFLRVESDISHQQLGDLLQKKGLTIANWESGLEEIPMPADNMLRNIYVELNGIH